MPALSPEQLDTLRAFIEARRASHLWFWRGDYLPQTREEWRLALRTVAKRADVPTWKLIREFETWL